MKSTIKILAILLVLNISSVIFPKQTLAQEGNVSFQVFYDQLSPYGQWVDYLNYGYVWIPDAGSDFVPYSSEGHWIYTDYGWTWVSDYDWGWAPFHYGRWSYSNAFGWFWVPDNQWGPSWVTWRKADGYYGWEPMEPGLTIYLSFGRKYDNHHDHWIFVRDRDIERSDIHSYYVNRDDHERIIRNSTVINKTYIDYSRHSTYITGPAREDVQKVTGRRVTSVAIHENDRPGQVLTNDQLRIYRPQVKDNREIRQKPVPSRVMDVKDVKRPAERNVTNRPRNANLQDNNKSQSIQPQRTNPQKNKVREQKPNTVQPQNRSNNAQPTQQRNVNSNDNKSRENQPNNVNVPNSNKSQPVQNQRSNPQENKVREQKLNVEQPQNRSNNVQPTQQRNVNSNDNKARESQPKSVNPPNNKPQSVQPQRSNSTENKETEKKSDDKTSPRR